MTASGYNRPGDSQLSRMPKLPIGSHILVSGEGADREPRVGTARKPSRNRGSGNGGWPRLVSLAEADAEKPVDHQGKGQDGEDRQQDRAA